VGPDRASGGCGCRWDALDLEEGAGVVAAARLFHGLLKTQERGHWVKNTAKATGRCRHGEAEVVTVRDRVVRRRPCADAR